MHSSTYCPSGMLSIINDILIHTLSSEQWSLRTEVPRPQQQGVACSKRRRLPFTASVSCPEQRTANNTHLHLPGWGHQIALAKTTVLPWQPHSWPHPRGFHPGTRGVPSPLCPAAFCPSYQQPVGPVEQKRS
eukprot:1156043-Pelagomonas_calceolata.AAC.25